jgi:hypothetical protein
MWAASLEKAKQPVDLRVGICDIRSFWLQVLGFPHARPRMYRFEVGVAACILIEAHSHTLSRVRVGPGRPGSFLDGSNFRAHPRSHGSGAWLPVRVHRLADLITAGSHLAGGQGTQKPARRALRRIRVGAGNFHFGGKPSRPHSPLRLLCCLSVALLCRQSDSGPVPGRPRFHCPPSIFRVPLRRPPFSSPHKQAQSSFDATVVAVLRARSRYDLKSLESSQIDSLI